MNHLAQCPCDHCGGQYAPLDSDQLRAGDRIADTYTLREGGTVIDTDTDRVAVVWDRAEQGWATYTDPAVVTLTYRPDTQAARELVQLATLIAHRE